MNFGFRRLSIIDIDNGNQPLSYENERYWIIFNGEIYNYIELRKELTDEGYEFTTDSDTEVILALYSSQKSKPSRNCAACSLLSFGINSSKTFWCKGPFWNQAFFYCEQDDVTYFASEKRVS